MTTEIAKRESGDMDLATLGQMLSRSGYFADARDAAQAVVKVLAGREVGLPPIASMTGIHIVKGKVTFAAATVAALIQRSWVYRYRVLEHTDAACEILFTEDGKEVGRSRFTMDDAQKAGLVAQNPTWRSYPRNMVFARALTNGARWYCPAVFGGPVYTPDELRHSDLEDLPEPAPAIVTTPEPELAAEAEAKKIVRSTARAASGHGEHAATDEQDMKDRREFLDAIVVRSKALGVTKGEYRKHWAAFIGADVPEDRAEVGKLMNLADWLAEQIKERREAEEGKPKT